jgi:hypothetical protein
MNDDKSYQISGSKGIDRISKRLDRMFPDDGIEAAIEYGSSKFLDKGDKIDIEQYLDKKDSFVIPIEQIVSCEKFSNPYWLGLGGHKNLKKRYTRIGIVDSTGVKTNYCIYINKPTNPENIHYIVRYDKWYDTIITATSPFYRYS